MWTVPPPTGVVCFIAIKGRIYYFFFLTYVRLCGRISKIQMPGVSKLCVCVCARRCSFRELSVAETSVSVEAAVLQLIRSGSAVVDDTLCYMLECMHIEGR